MNNVVSSKTAKRLKAAGFPQPKPIIGMSHYVGNSGYVYANGNIGSIGIFKLVDIGSQCETEVFAPSETDILKELGESFALRIDGEGLWLCLEEMEIENDTDGRSFIYYELKANNKNPAEAAAAAWLFVHEKK